MNITLGTLRTSGRGKHRRFVQIAGIAAIAIAATVVSFKRSSRPGTFLIRHLFESDAKNARLQMAPFAPSEITTILDVPYRAGDEDAKFDVYLPADLPDDQVPLPTVIWLHGGAWISGRRSDSPAFHQLIAEQGFCVIAVGYSIAPKRRYPTAGIQVNEALAFATQHASRFQINTNAIAIAGDSAGAQIATQISAITTNPDYAEHLGIRPSLNPAQLRALVLFCGIYDMDAVTSRDVSSMRPSEKRFLRLFRWGVETVLWAYTGVRRGDPKSLKEMSTINHVDNLFPSSFVSGGNADPLTKSQSRPFADTLKNAGVICDTLFFPDNHPTKLGHEYQFRLHLPEAQHAFDAMIAFLKRELTTHSDLTPS